VIERDPAKTDLPFVELPWIMAAHSDPATFAGALQTGRRENGF
jgi:hypothetical protein